MDRALITIVAAILIVWAGCLTILAGWVFDTTGQSMLLTLAAFTFSLGLAVGLPGRIARLIQRLLIHFKLKDLLMVDLATGNLFPTAKRKEARAIRHLCGWVTFFCVLCGVLSTLAIWAAGVLTDFLVRNFLWDSVAWASVQFLVGVIAFLPIALAMGVVFLSGTILRSGGKKDIYAKTFSDWLWAGGVALVALAGLWRLGANLMGVVFIAAIALGATGAVFFLFADKSQRGRRQLARPIEISSQYPRRIFISLSFGCLTFVLLIQCRIISDIGGLDFPARLCWVALSLALLAGFTKRIDKKSKPPGALQGLGCVIGLLAGAVLQTLLAIQVLSGGAGKVFCAIAAVMVQVPIAALAAILVSRHRRLFASNGGRARSFVLSTAVGMSFGFLAFLILGSLRATREALLAIVLGLCAICVMLAIKRALHSKAQLRWALFGAMLICGMAGGVLWSTVGIAEKVGSVRVGAWFSNILSPADAPYRIAREGALPKPFSWRSKAVNEALENIVAYRPGKWLMACSSHNDLPDNLPFGLNVVSSRPDPAAGRWGWYWIEGFSEGKALGSAQRTGREIFDGILLAPIPADHIHAWRCYNETALKRSIAFRHPNSPVLLRTQVRRNRFADAVAVAKTFRRAVGSGWALVHENQGNIDILLGGPAEFVEKPFSLQKVYILELDAFDESWPDIEPIRIVKPTATLKTITTLQMLNWLTSLED